MRIRSGLVMVALPVMLLGVAQSTIAGGYEIHCGYHSHGGGEIVAGVLLGLPLGHGRASHHHRHQQRVPQRVDHEPGHQRRRALVESHAEPQCVVEDDYLTTIVIDGQAVKGSGIACLKPDGTWRRK